MNTTSVTMKVRARDKPFEKPCISRSAAYREQIEGSDAMRDILGSGMTNTIRYANDPGGNNDGGNSRIPVNNGGERGGTTVVGKNPRTLL